MGIGYHFFTALFYNEIRYFFQNFPEVFKVFLVEIDLVFFVVAVTIIVGVFFTLGDGQIIVISFEI